MGTVFSFDIVSNPGGEESDRTMGPQLGGIVAWLHWVDATFSTYKENSEIGRLRKGEVPVTQCCPEVSEILELCTQLHAQSGGCFDAWADGSLEPSGVVKGWAIERASLMLTEAGFANHCINGGGDIRVSGSPGDGSAWHIGITHPLALDSYCAVLEISDGAVATSGTYERGFHVINPRSGRPVTNTSAVTVIGPDMALADAYATAAMVMGPAAIPWLEGIGGHEGFVVDASGRATSTSGFDRHRLGIRGDAVAGHR